MSLPLLQTKFYVPPSRPQLVRRAHLLDRLHDQGIGPLILISAPAGFGKTTLVSAWIHDVRTQRVAAHYDLGDDCTAELPSVNPKPVLEPSKIVNPQVAWLSLDNDDNDPTRFLVYLVAALQTQQANLGEKALSLLSALQAPPSKAVLTLLLHDLSALSAPLVLVLDDYHLVTAPPIHEALIFLIDHLPPHIHLIITSRIDPPLPLARWRVRNQLIEVRADDLRFTGAEATLFLNNVMGLTLSRTEITALEMRTEGWIAGLQLAALSMQGRADVASFIRSFSGSHRHVLSYLVEEVLHHQPLDTLSFLLQTSILDRMCAPLCDAVTGETDGQASLAKLEQANLFLIALDDEGKWYRYHHLFAEVLRSRLQQAQPALIPHLHARASTWYEQQALWSEAIHHTLAAADFVQAARLIEQVGIALFAQTNIQQALNRWLSRLPTAIIHERPRLCLIYAWSLFVGMDLAGAAQWVEEAEAALQRTPSSLANAIAGEIAAIRAMQAAYNPNQTPSEAITWGRQALATLNAEQATFRGVAALSLGMAAMKQGDVVVAEQALAEANRMGRVAGNVYSFVAAAANQVIMQRALGLGRLARTTCEAALVWVTQQSADAYPIVGSLYLNLADLLREQNELGNGARHAKVAITQSDQGVNRHFIIISRLVMLRMKQAEGDWGQAWALLREVSTLAEQYPNVIHNTLLPAITAQFQVAEEGFTREPSPALTAAYAWAQSSAWEESASFSAYNAYDFIYMLEHSRIARAQVFIAWARATADQRLIPETLAYLARQQQIAEAGSLRWFQIKLYLLQALAYATIRDAEQARSALIQVLHLAQPEGFVRVFMDEGEPLRLLMADLRAERSPVINDARVRLYVDQLVTAFGSEKRTHLLIEHKIGNKLPDEEVLNRAERVPAKIANLVEPLSARELEVLQLVAVGLSNMQIAARLIVTTGTVKAHINHIFGKLAVESRIQAVVRAREHGLLND